MQTVLFACEVLSHLTQLIEYSFQHFQRVCDKCTFGDNSGSRGYPSLSAREQRLQLKQIWVLMKCLSSLAGLAYSLPTTEAGLVSVAPSFPSSPFLQKLHRNHAVFSRRKLPSRKTAGVRWSGLDPKLECEMYLTSPTWCTTLALH